MAYSKNAAIIFDIKRFAVHDGPGIRTSVFFKGCPLGCKWCHNPEGIALKPQLWYFFNQCIHCGDCITSCPNNALSFNSKEKIEVDRRKCTVCGTCTKVCPTRALNITGEEKSIDELEEILLKDITFYEKSGGGITLTGGEPLAQPQAAIALLKRMKDKGIHTAVESSLQAKRDILEAILPLVDFFITDLKVFDSNLHKQHTGLGNKLIIDNMKYLFKTNKEMLVRVPIIPGYTDSNDNLEEIADFVAKAGRTIPVELMNFNPLARDKFEVLGKPYAPADVTEPYSEAEMERFRNIFKLKGLKSISG